MRKIVSFIIFLLMASAVFAHTPIITQENSEGNPVIVENPEISKAYYGEMNGTPDFYRIVANEPFDFYINILIPYDPVSYNREFSVLVMNNKRMSVTFLEESVLDWKPYFEEFSGVNYLQGPEAKKRLDPGNYTIRVYNKGNAGKYVLAIGEKEDISGIIANTFTVYPFIKEQFFGQPVFLLLFHLLGIVIAFGAVIFVYFVLYRTPRETRKLLAENEGAIKKMIWVGIVITAVTLVMILSKNTSNMFNLTRVAVLALIVLNQLSLTKLMAKRRKRVILSMILWLIFLFITVLAI
ncbi:MAG: hypothetical protein NT120_02895 [Candidatus Aenigmarchaeota archaeon]|nr:hypothetical protein [Candidatus Aenigmarchaeota archaeon]